MNISTLQLPQKQNQIPRQQFRESSKTIEQTFDEPSNNPVDGVDIGPQVVGKRGTRKTDKVEQPDQLFAELVEAMFGKLSPEKRDELCREAQLQAQGSDPRPYLAALAYQLGVTELQESCANLSRAEIRKLAHTRPELKKTISLVDKAVSFLKSEKRLVAEQERQQSMNRIKEIYEKMNAENRRAWQEMWQIRQAADKQICEMWHESYLRKLESWNKFQKSFLKVLLDG